MKVAKKPAVRWHRTPTGHYVWGPYEAFHLHARGGWSSWTVEKNGAYFGNWPTLAMAKRRSETDAERGHHGGVRAGASRVRAGGGAVVAMATGRAGGDVAAKLLDLASRRGVSEEVVELVHEGLAKLYRGDVDAARRYLRRAEREQAS